MKVLMIHNKYQIPGGEGKTFERESGLLERFDHQVYRYVRESNEISKSISKLEVGVRVIWSQKDYLRVSQIIKEFNPDIIHVYNFFPLISPSVYYSAKKRVPIIQTLQNYRFWCLNGYFIRDQLPCELCLNKPIALPGIAYKCYRDSLLESSAVAVMQSFHNILGTWRNRVDRYIVTTEFFRQKAIQGGLPSHKLSVKPNFVDPDPGRETDKKDFVVFVGRLFPEKGIGMLLKAWMNYPDLPPIKLIGQGPMESDVRQVESQISNLEYLGQLSSPEVYEWMGKAKALVFPSQWYEGLPLTIVESFAKGTPVIASRLGAMESLILHQYNGLHFEAGNIEDMISQIRWMNQHPGEWLQMQRNGRQYFESQFTAEKNYHSLIEIYQKAIAQLRN